MSELSPVDRIRLRHREELDKWGQAGQERDKGIVALFQVLTDEKAAQLIKSDYKNCRIYTWKDQEYAGSHIYDITSDDDFRGLFLHLLIDGAGQYRIVEDRGPIADRVSAARSIINHDYDLTGEEFDVESIIGGDRDISFMLDEIHWNNVIMRRQLGYTT